MIFSRSRGALNNGAGCGSGFRAVEVMEVPKIQTELQTGPTNQTNQAAAETGHSWHGLELGNSSTRPQKIANFSKQILKSKRAGWKVHHESTCITYISYQK